MNTVTMAFAAIIQIGQKALWRKGAVQHWTIRTILTVSDQW